MHYCCRVVLTKCPVKYNLQHAANEAAKRVFVSTHFPYLLSYLDPQMLCDGSCTESESAEASTLIACRLAVETVVNVLLLNIHQTL